MKYIITAIITILILGCLLSQKALSNWQDDQVSNMNARLDRLQDVETEPNLKGAF